MNAGKVLSVIIVLVGSLAFITAPAAYGGLGDIAIYTSPAQETGITTADFNHVWTNTVKETIGNTSFDLNGSDIELNAGHYMVLYNSRFDSTGGSYRSEIQSQLTLGGADLPIGWSQGFIRRMLDDNEMITSGGGIIDVTSSGDPLSLVSFRTDANGGAGVKRAASATGIQLLKLNDTWDYLNLSTSANYAAASTGRNIWAEVTYDVQTEVDAGSFAHTIGTGDVTLVQAGHYMVFANSYLQFDRTDSRTVYKQRLTLDGTTEIPGSRTTVYLRGNAQDDSCFDGAVAIGTIIETASPNQILNVELAKEGGRQSSIIAGRTGLTIVKLPDDGEYIRLDNSTNDQNFNPDTVTAMGWDTELEKDGAGFRHDAGGRDSRVTATQTDDYLFFTSLYDNDDGNERIQYWQRWKVNDTDFAEYGQSGGYSRSLSVGVVGNWSGAMFDMEGGDFIEVTSQRLGNSGTLSNDIKGLQGVRLGSLFTPATQITAPEIDLQDGLPLEMATVSPGGDGEVGELYGIWLRGDGVGGDSDYRWSISGGPEALPDTLLATLPDTDLDGSVDDYFLTFAHLADAGARDRALTSPYTLRLEALDSGGLPIAGSESEILLLVPEPATLSLLALGGLAVLRRRSRQAKMFARRKRRR